MCCRAACRCPGAVRLPLRAALGREGPPRPGGGRGSGLDDERSRAPGDRSAHEGGQDRSSARRRGSPWLQPGSGFVHSGHELSFVLDIAHSRLVGCSSRVREWSPFAFYAPRAEMCSPHLRGWSMYILAGRTSRLLRACVVLPDDLADESVKTKNACQARAPTLPTWCPASKWSSSFQLRSCGLSQFATARARLSYRGRPSTSRSSMCSPLHAPLSVDGTRRGAVPCWGRDPTRSVPPSFSPSAKDQVRAVCPGTEGTEGTETPCSSCVRACVCTRT